jgi:acetyl esterase/lipase
MKRAILLSMLLGCFIGQGGSARGEAPSHAFPHKSVVILWPAGSEKVNPDIPETIVPKDFEVVKDIHNPNLTVFRPAKPNGTAVVICPGGGYSIIATGLAGYPVAERLNEAGITAFVLKYRLPSTKGAGFKHPVPMSDALRAVQWVRFHANDFGLDSDKIGLMGFSAGGHLAATAGTLFGKYSFGNDAVSKVASRPDFMALVFPVITTRKGIAHGCSRSPVDPKLSKEQLPEMSSELNVSKQTPPTFLAHAKDDTTVNYQNSVLMHEALLAHGVPTELKLYEKGGHGFGLGREGTDSMQWPGDFVAWMKGLYPDLPFGSE